MPPIAAIVPGFLLLAVPVILAATAWAAWAMWHLVVPEDEREQAQSDTDASVPVGLADILEQQRRRPSIPVVPRHQRVGTERERGDDRLADDLWRRRN